VCVLKENIVFYFFKRFLQVVWRTRVSVTDCRILYVSTRNVVWEYVLILFKDTLFMEITHARTFSVYNNVHDVTILLLFLFFCYFEFLRNTRLFCTRKFIRRHPYNFWNNYLYAKHFFSINCRIHNPIFISNVLCDVHFYTLTRITRKSRYSVILFTLLIYSSLLRIDIILTVYIMYLFKRRLYFLSTNIKREFTYFLSRWVQIEIFKSVLKLSRIS